uniref:Uncharacterized protein n=1 Tax=Strongyloides stercoralis TaxID=6248 RepID=A0A0K0E243_STRER
MYLFCIFLFIIFLSTPTCNSKKRRVHNNLEDENQGNINRKAQKSCNDHSVENEENKEIVNSNKVQDNKNVGENVLPKHNLSKNNQCNMKNQNNTDKKLIVNKNGKKIEKNSKNNLLLTSLKNMKDKLVKKDISKKEVVIIKATSKMKKTSDGNDKIKNEKVDKTQVTESNSDYEDSQKLFDDRVKLIKVGLDKEEGKQDVPKNNNNQFFIEDNIEVWACNSLSNSTSVIKF